MVAGERPGFSGRVKTTRRRPVIPPAGASLCDPVAVACGDPVAVAQALRDTGMGSGPAAYPARCRRRNRDQPWRRVSTVVDTRDPAAPTPSCGPLPSRRSSGASCYSCLSGRDQKRLERSGRELNLPWPNSGPNVAATAHAACGTRSRNTAMCAVCGGLSSVVVQRRFRRRCITRSPDRRSREGPECQA